MIDQGQDIFIFLLLLTAASILRLVSSDTDDFDTLQVCLVFFYYFVIGCKPSRQTCTSLQRTRPFMCPWIHQEKHGEKKTNISPSFSMQSLNLCFIYFKVIQNFICSGNHGNHESAAV